MSVLSYGGLHLILFMEKNKIGWYGQEVDWEEFP